MRGILYAKASRLPYVTHGSFSLVACLNGLAGGAADRASLKVCWFQVNSMPSLYLPKRKGLDAIDTAVLERYFGLPVRDESTESGAASGSKPGAYLAIFRAARAYNLVDPGPTAAAALQSSSTAGTQAVAAHNAARSQLGVWHCNALLAALPTLL